MVKDIVDRLVAIAFVCFLVMLCVRLFSLTAATEAQTDTFLKADDSSSAIWTTEPVKVNPALQSYKRIPTPPDPYPLKLRIAADRFVLTNNTFLAGGDTFRFANVAPVERNKVCLDAAGRRFACGLQAYKALQNAVRRKRLECRVVALATDAKVVECLIDSKPWQPTGG